MPAIGTRAAPFQGTAPERKITVRNDVDAKSEVVEEIIAARFVAVFGAS
jgi:hypothetical protein